MIALADCNNFYVSCERVFNPALEGKPVGVMSNNDGCVIARSAEMKAMEISMGTPAYQLEGLRRRGVIHLLSSNYELYGDMSARLAQLLRDTCPEVAPYSIDEMFIYLDGLSDTQCQALGSTLGQMHKVSQHFPGHRPNPRDLHWLRAVHHKVLTYISPDDQTLMKNAVDDFESEFSQHGELPQGAVHGDLFRDNTLFEGDALGGIIDFYNGCTGDLLFDLAIVINDWASNEDGSLNAERYHAILSAYQARRPLTETERTLWPTMLRMTALRYWLSRLLVVYVDPPAHDLTPHDPERFRVILKARIAWGALPIPEASS